MNISNKKMDYEKIIKELLQDDRIMKEVSKNGLTKEQIIEAIPILIDMKNQDKNDDYVTTFYISKTGKVMRQEVLSAAGENNLFIQNIITFGINAFDYSDNEFFKEDSRKELVNKFLPFLNADNTYKKGLYIYGNMGIGKTFIAKKFLIKLAKMGKKVGMVNLSELSTKIKSTFSGPETYGVIVNDLKNVEYLFIDDIGAESISSWFRDEILFNILNYRMERHNTTFFTSNYSIKNLEQIEAKTANSKYRDYDKSKRLIERIKALCTEIHLTGKNLR
ncbi:ATP-binding protein [Candidatus Mycoplasma mahonii]|uniref:ATP-binding protein n=1 Tax=Candidatus Mycoplasma mahonii TaxID=3004105 RepID=UPI0026EDCA5C|nr:ATP-binding protein [Candidatus Mycoplasma mahonii]WKX02700.1 ATP-binding protein [Candidatus Mycoplasma mahonii]